MPAAETARLIASLELGKNTLQPGLDKASKGVDTLGGKMSALGSRAGQGLKTAGANLAKVGVIAGAGIAVAVKTGLDDLAKLETAITATDGAIKALGLTGQLTGKQVAQWANDIERDVGAAFDDKDITAASATLLRFGKVTPANLKPALVVMTDLAAKTGSVESAASVLAKALADPEKAAGKLTRAGVVLTKAQQDQIKAMVKAGDVAGAQAFLLDKVAASTKGAALASQGPYARALAVLSDTAEDARKALAIGFLPVIEKVAAKLSTAVADPAVLAGLEDFGKTLAGAFDQLLVAAEKIPWGTIGQSLKLAGSGAKAVLDAFVGMPPWVQTAVLTGWGLNKLTGGALGGIVGELGKGLVKGVLGMNAGVVNINAATVNGAGGVPASTAATGLGLASKVFVVGAAAGVFAGVVGFAKTVNDGIEDQKKAVTGAFRDFLANNPTRKQIEDVIRAQEAIPASLNPIERLLFESNTNGVKTVWDEGLAELRRAATASETTAKAIPTAFSNSPSQHDHAAADEAAAKIATATSTAIRTAAEQARAGRNRIDVVEGGGAKGLAVAADFVRILEAGPGQWGQKLENQQRVLEAIRDAEKDARAKGDTVVAGKLDTLEQRLVAIIKATEANKPKPIPVDSKGKDDRFVPSKTPGVVSPDARDHTAIDKLDAINAASVKSADNTSEMRTEFIADRKAAELAAQRIADTKSEITFLRGDAVTASLNSSSRLDSLRQITANVQTGVVGAVNQMSANVTAAIANIRLIPPTINIPRPPTPVVNVNISNRAVNTAVSRNTTFTRPL